MTDPQGAFPTRLLRLSSADGFEAAPQPPIDPKRINQHIEGQTGNPRGMTDAEIAQLLGDPFATLVLRQGVFPKTLTELLAAIDKHNTKPDGLPQQSSFLIAEGGQIPFKAGLDKGNSRLLTVRSRANSPELMISTLVAAGVDPRSDRVLLEVIAWDAVNQTFHFYQRQEGSWFWCGQSDMALVPPTRGQGAFDSHVNGYVVMKELKTPWVHWHGPGLGIAETAYSPNDPLVTDPLFVGRDHALNFEMRVIRPLAERWNQTRFAKDEKGATVRNLDQYFRQILESSTANLISTHKEWSQINSGDDLNDIPPTFFFDQDGLAEAIGIPVNVPPLRLTRARYKALVSKHKLRVIGNGVDQAGDVPFCFTVPERAFEDTLALQVLVQNQVMSDRLAAALLMIDFSNPVTSARRSALLKYVPASAGTTSGKNLDKTMVDAITAAAPATPVGSPERTFVEHWNLGGDSWQPTYAQRLDTYLRAVAAKLGTDAGADEIFRLAESRRREFRQRPLAEFGLSLPQATAIPASAKPLEMTESAAVRIRKP